MPIRRRRLEQSDELTDYLRMLSRLVEVIVVDGSPPDVFAAHADQWSAWTLHMPVDADLTMPNGKVNGVLTGVRHARHERLIIADDDVRYDQAALTRLIEALNTADVVRPQNYFDPLPWHARWDTGRTLLNRITGGDWPGTLGVRRSTLLAAGGYDGNVLFENLELVRTIRAVGGTAIMLPDLFVRRLPPTARHFWSQRVRQAYDEFARPVRMCLSLALLPLVILLAVQRGISTLILGAGLIVAFAEMGRRRAGGRAVFPPSSALWAPPWVLERAVCIWLALGTRLIYGGVRYHALVMSRAATSQRVLDQRFRAVRASCTDHQHIASNQAHVTDHGLALASPSTHEKGSEYVWK